jgi:hypothetical protein
MGVASRQGQTPDCSCVCTCGVGWRSVEGSRGQVRDGFRKEPGLIDPEEPADLANEETQCLSLFRGLGSEREADLFALQIGDYGLHPMNSSEDVQLQLSLGTTGDLGVEPGVKALRTQVGALSGVSYPARIEINAEARAQARRTIVEGTDHLSFRELPGRVSISGQHCTK